MLFIHYVNMDYSRDGRIVHTVITKVVIDAIAQKQAR